MSYQRLGHYDFGAGLLQTGDLDPVYIMLHRADLEPPALARWLVAYWCFYHSGVASALTETPDFWAAARAHAATPKSARGTERRHFRGPAAPRALDWLRERWAEPEDWVRYLSTEPTFASVAARAQEAPLFGPWIAFKIADMLERCAGAAIDFSGCELSIYAEPKKGATLIAQQEGWPDTLQYVCDRLAALHGHHLAPPDGGRLVNIQEIETILCKFKSHWGGHYPLGKDTHETREQLHGWGPLAEKLEKVYP